MRGIRAPAALEDDSKWQHDKFDLLKVRQLLVQLHFFAVPANPIQSMQIGPPPGLGASQRHRRSGGGTSGMWMHFAFVMTCSCANVASTDSACVGQLQQDVGDYNTGRKSPSVIPAARFQHGQQERMTQPATAGKCC